MIRSLASLVLGSLSLCPLAAQAIIAQSSGLPNPGQVIDFGANVLPNFTPVTTQFAGITVNTASYFTTGTSVNLVGGFLTQIPNSGSTQLRIQFAAPIIELSFVWHQVALGTPTTMSALLQGAVVDSFTGSWSQFQTNNYFGFTNTVFDELRIDFVSDFNLDTLAFTAAPSSQAACTLHNGGNLNPVGFVCSTLPQLGTTWQGSVAHNANTLLSALAYAPNGLSAPVPLFGGELLVDPGALVLFAGGPNYSFPVPAAPSWTGTVLTFQGLRLEQGAGGLAIVPLNAVQLLVGT
jgi:hypothetical protein